MKSAPTARFEISSCEMPAVSSRVRPSLVLSSTELPVGWNTPLTKPFWVGVPVSSLASTNPLRFRSDQHVEPATVLHAPLFWLLPQVSDAVFDRPDNAFASVIFVL